MKAGKLQKLLFIGLTLNTILACNFFEGISPSLPTSKVLPLQSPPPPAITASPAGEIPSETAGGPGTQTPVAPTPIQGPAIQRLTSNQRIDITYIHMIDANQGWGIGGPAQAQDHVFRTWNGGVNWSDVTPPQPAPAARETESALGFFADASDGWVVYSPTDTTAGPSQVPVWSTHDGGASWSYGLIDTTDIPREYFMPWYLDFSDNQHGWMLVLLGGGMNHAYVALYSTIDGGGTWRDILDPSMENGIQSFEKTGLVFTNAQVGWLTRDAQGVDSTPHAFLTQDGGTSWNRIDLPAPTGTSRWFDENSCGTYFPSLSSASSMLLIMKCLDNATYKEEHDYLYSTKDTGQTWQSAPMPSAFKIPDPPAGGLFFMDAMNGLALSRWIYRTDDGGKNWSTAKLVNWDGQFSFVDIDTGWAVARNEGEMALVKTGDGGNSWEVIKPTVGP